MTRVRAGFTLIELLVATGVFVIGFVAVFGLFLAGIRFRKLSDDTARAAVAASSLINEFRIDAGREGGGPKEPVAYVGDGFAKAGPEPAGYALGDEDTGTADQLELYEYTAQPGIWYRVLRCTSVIDEPTDLTKTNDANATTLRMRLLVLPWGSPETAGFTLDDVNRRLRLLQPVAPPPNSKALIDELVNRGLAFTYDAAFVRNPSWR